MLCGSIPSFADTQATASRAQRATISASEGTRSDFAGMEAIFFRWVSSWQESPQRVSNASGCFAANV